jgi:hypothetical protein
MSAVTLKQQRREECAAQLTDAAYPIALKHGMRGFSVDAELEVWKAIESALGEKRLQTPREEVLAEVSDAAYRVALERGFEGSFVDLELHLWHTLKQLRPRLCADMGRGQTGRNVEERWHSPRRQEFVC